MVDFNYSDENGIWVRISEYTHSNPSMPTITLLPMIHIGEKEFFKEINHEMWRHDTAFLEGCYMPARKLFHLFHRVLGAFSGLSLQSGKLSFWKKWKRENKVQGKTGLTEKLRKSGCHCGKCHYDELLTIRADLHRWHALKAFRAIPLWAKFTFPFLIIAAIIASPFVNLRDHIFDDCEDNQNNEDGLLDKLMEPFWKFVIHDRDLFLRTVLAEEIIRPRHEAKRLCVKYGAKHMPVLAETLLEDFGYTLEHSRSVLAVRKTKGMEISSIKTGYGIAKEKYWDEVDAKDEQIKSKVTELTISLPQNSKTLNIESLENPKPISLSIQTDYSSFPDYVVPSKAA